MSLFLRPETLILTQEFSRRKNSVTHGHKFESLERAASERPWWRDFLSVPTPEGDAGRLSAKHLSGDIWGYHYPRRRSFWLLGFFASLAIGAFISATFSVSLPRTVELPGPGEYKKVVLVAPPAKLLKSFYQKEPGSGGGGGGRTTQEPPSKGRPPRFAAEQIIAPSTIPVENAALPIVPTIIAEPTKTLDLSMVIGDPAGIPGPPSDGQGSPAGIGTGKGSGVGAGKGSGAGVGSGKGIGTSSSSFPARSKNSGIVAPVLTHEVKPRYTQDAYESGIEGQVILRITIDTDGRVSSVLVVQSLDDGLDSAAKDAVSRWIFKPGTKDGVAVALSMIVPVYFQK